MITAAVLLIIIWPGHSIPMQPMSSAEACHSARDLIRSAAANYVGAKTMRVWCEPPTERLVS
jgi:hypothetical protein